MEKVKKFVVFFQIRVETNDKKKKGKKKRNQGSCKIEMYFSAATQSHLVHSLPKVIQQIILSLQNSLEVLSPPTLSE